MAINRGAPGLVMGVATYEVYKHVIPNTHGTREVYR